MADRTRRIGRRAIRTLPLALALLLVAAPGAFAQVGPDDAWYRTRFEEGLRQLREGRYDGAIATFTALTVVRPERPEPYYNIACGHCLKGEPEEALPWLEKAFEKGFHDERHVDSDKDLDAVRALPGYQTLMARHFGRAIKGPMLATLSGGEASLDKLKGKVVCVLFWRAGSAPCQKAIEQLNEVARTHEPRGVFVIGVSRDEAKVQEKAADDLKIAFPLLRQVGATRAPFTHAVDAYPRIYVLDREGRVAAEILGLDDRAALEKALEPLIAPGSAPAPDGRQRSF